MFHAVASVAVPLEFGILGPLEVRSEEGEIALRGTRARVLLAALLLERNRAVDPDRLAAALYGDDAPHGAGGAVRVQVSRLRAALGDPGALVTTPAGYELRVGPEAVDADRFEALLADGRALLDAGAADEAGARLREALALWRGPALAGVATGTAEAARLEELRLDALEARVEADLAPGPHAELVAELGALAERHPHRERLHAQRMLALYRAGRQADALDAYRQARAYLSEQLGLEPSADLRELERRILNQDPGLRPAAEPATALFGRERDVDAVLELLARARLVTLTGPGGVGKTALAREFARRLPTPAHVVELAEVRDPANVAAAIAASLGVEPPRLRAATRPLTLVLDNFEHLLDAAPLVAELAEACTVVVTSQVPLNLSAERVHPVEPLREPHAVELFRDRARARDPRFELGPGNAEAVATICRRLGGLPLALELAAGRIGFLEPDELAAALDDALGLLVGGARDGPDRHRTLRATLDWSHDLLDEDQRRAFARLAVFAGGAPLDAALAVTEADLLTLEALAGAQLVTRVGRRLRMLEPVREYAAERLGDDAAVRERHARWCERHARTAGAELAGEADNVRAALRWALASGRGELALALACACGPWWARTGQSAEGRANVEAALALAGDDAPAPLRAEALRFRARFHPRTVEAAVRRRADLMASLALWRELGDVAQQADCQLWLSGTERLFGDAGLAIDWAEQALRLARELGDDALVARALAARAAAEPEHPDVVARTREALRALERAEELDDALRLLMVVGYAALADGRLEQAREVLEAGLPVAGALGVHNARFFVHGNLGLALFFLGDDAAAVEELCRSLEAARAGELEEIDEALLTLAALAARDGDLERAALLTGAARAHITGTLGPDERRIHELLQHDHLAPARQRLGEERWDELAARSARMSRDEAIELAVTLAAG